MSTFSAPLDELEQQAPPKASSAPLDDLDAAPAPSLTKSQANTELTRDPLGPGSSGYKAKPAPRSPSRFSDVWYPNGVSTEAQAGAVRAASPQAAASKAAGMPLADVAGKPHDPQLDQPTQYNAKTGLPYQEPLVPEAEGWKDPLIHIAAGAEPIATGLSRYSENDKPVYGTDPNNRFGPVRRELSKEEEERQSRERMLGASEVLEGSGQLGMVAVPASLAAAPIRTALGFGAGYLASEGAGKAVHGHVSPEAEELTRQVAFFIPSAAGTVAGIATGFKTSSLKAPGPRGTSINEFSAFGDKVAGGVRITPEDVTVGGRVGDTQIGKKFSRGFKYSKEPVPPDADEATAVSADQAAAVSDTPNNLGQQRQLPVKGTPFTSRPPVPITGTPHVPEPSEAAKALASFEQHTGNPDFQPAPPPPVPPGTNGPEHLTPDVVKGVSDAIMQAPAAKRPNLMTEAHGNMVKWMMGRGTFTGPDGKIHTVDAEGPAKKLASKFINDEVDRRDAEAEKAAKAVEQTPKAQAAAVSTTAPIAGKPPAAGNMTTDTAAVAKVATEANIHPQQQPAVAVKKESPKETAALAQPPKPVKPEDVAAIGKEDKASERTILQPSDDVMQNERLASHAAPELATKLSHIAAGVPGARFDRLRPQKELERVDEKVDDAGKPPETVPDYLAAQIAADTPQAKDQLIAALHKNFNVIQIEDNFLEGKKELANYRSANVQVGMGNGSTAEVQIVPREQQETANQSHVFYTAGREAELRGDHAERDKQFAKAAEMHDAAMEKFNQRNGIEPKPKHEFASTQINIDPQSELGQAHAQAVAAIPKEHVGKEGLEKTPHVTIRYGLKDDSPAGIERIKAAAAQIQPFEVPIGKTDVFLATEHSSFDHPVIARLETTPEMKALRKVVEGAGAFKEDNFPEYKPHVTLGYIKKEFAQQYKGGNQLEGQTVPVKEITVSKRDGTQESIPLGGQQQSHSAPLDELEAQPQGNRSYEDVQKDIDRHEDELEKSGVNPTRLYFSNNAEAFKGNPEWSPMPKDLESLYDERDKIGSGLMKQNTGEIAYRLQKVGLSDKEVTRVMRDQYSLKRGETTGADHYMATEHTQTAAARDPRSQAKEIYIKLADERGIPMDNEDDLWRDKKTTQDAIKAAKAIYTYFGGEWTQKDNLLPEGRQNTESTPERRTAERGPDRRKDIQQRKRVADLTSNERAHELLTSELTGLPNKRAFAEDAATLAESHPHVGYADIDDFKAFNTELGHEGVDEKVLPVVGEIFRNAAAKEPGGSVKVYHRSGDEFLFRAKDEAAIGRVVDRVNKELQNAVFTAESPDGKLHTKQGAGVSHGTGRDAKSAEAAAGLDKQRRKQAGLRSGARDVPEPVGQEPAQREQTEVSHAAHSAPLEEIEAPPAGYKADLKRFAEEDQIEEEHNKHKLAAQSEVGARVSKLIDRFMGALSAGTLPTDPREIRAMAKAEVGGDPAKYVDDIYDAIEGATNRYMRERRPGGTLGRRISYAETVEKQIGKRTRTLEITKLQQFSTPHTISEAAAYATGARPDDTVLEPTAGTGNLVEPIRTDAEILTNELDSRRMEVLKANDYQHVTQLDYLKSNFKADVIVTNPPWGKISSGRYKALDVPAPWGRFNDVSERFMVKNLRDLPEGGRLVAVVPTTILQPGSAGFRKWIDQSHTLRAMIQSPPDAYIHRGTDVDSVLMVVDKGKIQGAEKPILRLELNQPKNWAEYAEAVKPLADGGSHARVERTGRETGEAEERAPLGDRTPAESEGVPAGTDGGRGLPELREPGGSPEPVRSERSGMGAELVSERDVPEAVDSPGADGAAQPAATPRLVRQGARALRPKDVSAARLKEFDEASDSPVFTPYVLRSDVSGNPHPRQIVETRSLAGAPAPEVDYQPSKGVLDAHKRKVISDEQVDTVAAIGQAIKNGHAYMVADDVGLGKSRELGATAIDWLEKGTAKRILVTSKGEVNLRDLESEMKIVAGTDNLPFKYVYLRDYKEAAERAQSKNPYSPVPASDNTVYVVESFNLTPYRRAIQDLKIDGVLGDEVHTYKNEDAGVGQTWKVLHADWLQRKVPIAYFTATPGTTLDDLEYLYGLREWKLDGFGDWVARKTGHGTVEAQKKRGEVKGQTQDISEQVGSDATDVSKSGRVTKAAQALAAARLSGDRQLIEHFEAELKQAQKDEKNKKWGQSKGDSFRVTVSTAEMEQIMRELKMKGKYGARDLWRAGVEFGEKEAPLTKTEAEGYRRAVAYMREVEKAFNAFANENEAMRKGFGVTAHLQAAAKRLLFDRRLKRAIAEAKESLARGEQPVISLINVNPTVVGEGYMAAALNQINVNKVIVDKESGEVTDLGEIPEAVAVKNELIERAEQEFPPSPDPIAMIQKEFGKDKVAVITGNESPKVRRQMMEDFQKGIKKAAVISGAGKTGISLHHVIETPGGAKGRRHLILADYEWSATNFKQELGRVDRSGQASPPKITALTLGSAAEKKFISTIANRMKTLGAVSKGAAESTGTGALEHFELGGDIDNQVVREMWRTMPLSLREQFRGRHFMNYDQDGVARPKSAIENVGVRDFLLQLQLIPIEEGNKIWEHFWKHREETYSGDAVAAREAQKTGKTKGEILRTHTLGPDLDLYEVKDAAGHRAGILSGMVTEHMGALQQHLDSGEEKTAEGMTVVRKRREYTTFTGSKGEQISGLRLRPGQIEPIAKAFGKGIVYEHTPETALQDVIAGDKVPLDNGWTLYMGKGGEKKGYVIIDGAKLSNTNRGQDVLRHGAKYNAVSGGFFYLPEDKAAVQGFLERFPIKKQTAEKKETVVPDVKKPEPAERPRRSIKQSPESLSAKELEQYFTPGKIVTGYAGQRDKVIAFHPADSSKPYPDNRWSVDVVAADAQGEPIAGERVRHHATMPDRREIAKFRREAEVKGKPSERGFVRLDIASLPKEAFTSYLEKRRAASHYTTQARLLEEGLAGLDRKYEADVLDTRNMLRSVTRAFKPEEQEAVYHAIEAGRDAGLTAKEKALKDDFVKPVQAMNQALREELTGFGWGDLYPQDGYIHRIVEGKPGRLESAAQGQQGGKGNLLSRSTPSTKERRMFALEDEDGHRIVVHKADGRITAFDHGKPVDMGAYKTLKPEGQFTDKDGQEWTLKQATTKEIEGATDIRYYKNAMAVTALDNLELQRAVNAARFLETFKSRPDFDSIAMKAEAGEKIPAGWKHSQIPQFRGYAFEPRTREVLDDLHDRMTNYQPPTALEKIGDFLQTSVLLNPLMHVANMADIWATERGALRTAQIWKADNSVRAGMRALQAVTARNEDYLNALRSGAPLMSHKLLVRDLNRAFQDVLTGEIAKDKGLAAKVREAMALPADVNPIEAIRGASHSGAFMSNDIFLLQSVYDKMETSGVSFEAALRQTMRTFPEYRVPTRVADSKMLADLMKNRLMTWFSGYHYGKWRAFRNMAADSVRPGASAEDRKWAISRIAMLGLLVAVVYPAYQALIKKLSGDPNARVKRFGLSGTVQNVIDVHEGKKDIAQAVESEVTPSALLKGVVETATNRDSFTGNYVRDPNASGLKQAEQSVKHLAGSAIGPVSQYRRYSHEPGGLKKFLWSQVGVTFPKTETETKAAILMNRIRREHYAPMTPDEQDEFEKKMQRIAEGKLTPQEMHSRIKSLMKNEFERGMKSFTYDQAKQVYDVASPEEKAMIGLMLLRKRFNSRGAAGVQ